MQMYGESRDFTDEQVGDEDPLLEVERIVKQRGKGKKAEFLVKWVGSLRSASLRWHQTVAKWLVKGAGFDQGVDDSTLCVHPSSK